MTDKEQAKALYDAAKHAIGKLTSSPDVRLNTEEWTYIDDLRRAIREYEEQNSIGVDDLPF